MMREIKFRAWDKVSKKLSQSFSLFGEFTLLGAVFAWVDHFRGTPDGTSGIASLNDLEIMQYTGLKDKNGVEIYEGDIIKVLSQAGSYGDFYVLAAVELHHGIFGFMNLLVKHFSNPNNWDKNHSISCSGWFLGGFSPLNGQDYSVIKGKCDAYGSQLNVEVIGNIHETPELLT